jgi:hypothetical protein
MTLPENFSPTEHFQDLVRRVYNREVREWFADFGDDEDINSPRGTLKRGCLHLEDDPVTLTLARMHLFDMQVRRLAEQPILGVPNDNFQQAREFVPQIVLYFKEDLQDVEPGFQAIDGVIRVRVKGETSDTISMAKAESLARDIRSEFATGGGYVWRKGRSMMTYVEKQKQYKLHILCRSESEGREVVGKVLNIQNDTPKWELAKLNDAVEPGQAYPANPGTEVVLGKSRKKVRRRPIADVRFQHALLHVWGTERPTVLVDRSGRFRYALAS